MAQPQEQSHASDNKALLEAVAENTEMGKNTLNQILTMTDDEPFRTELKRQLNRYRELNQQAHTGMAACGGEVKGQSAFAKVNTAMGIELKSLLDKSTRNFAEMLIQGSEMGVNDCITALRDYPLASPGARTLAGQLQTFQSDSAQRLREFL